MSVIKDSDVQSIREVAKAVETYAEGIKNDIEKLMKRHDDMHSSWSGEQYDDLTDVLIEAKKVLTKQSANLLEISKQIEEDADRLEKAKSTKIK